MRTRNKADRLRCADNAVGCEYRGEDVPLAGVDDAGARTADPSFAEAPMNSDGDEEYGETGLAGVSTVGWCGSLF